MSFQTISFQSIQPPQGNPRSTFDPDLIEGLAARRYRALKLLQERGDSAADYKVPVKIRSKLSKDDPLRLATVENVHRENPPPLDEAAAFAALIRKGESLDDLAAKTGLSPTTISRRLVLNNLCEEVKAALSKGTVSLAQAEALTLGDHDAQRDVLEDIEQGHGPYSAADIPSEPLDDAV